MKTSAMLKQFKLTQADFDKIKEATEKAESATTGEIRTAITAESAHYAFWELLAAICTAAFVFAVSLPFAQQLRNAYSRIAWSEYAWSLPALYGLICFAVIIIAFYIFNIPALDKIIIPRAVRSANVSRRAFRFFAESGVYATSEHSGILIFISCMEKEVRIIADTGISKKISHDLWQLISDELASDIKAGNATQGFINAIEKCGSLLAENFPARAKNQNELPDGLVILEDAEWY